MTRRDRVFFLTFLVFLGLAIGSYGLIEGKLTQAVVALLVLAAVGIAFWVAGSSSNEAEPEQRFDLVVGREVGDSQLLYLLDTQRGISGAFLARLGAAGEISAVDVRGARSGRFALFPGRADGDGQWIYLLDRQTGKVLSSVIKPERANAAHAIASWWFEIEGEA